MPHLGTFYIDLVQPAEFIQFGDLDLLMGRRIMGIEPQQFLSDRDHAVFYFSHADTAHVFIVIDRRDQDLGRCLGISFRGGWIDIAAPLGQPPVFYRSGSAFEELFASLREL